MKKTYLLPATLTFAMFVGCGGKPEQTANGPTSVDTNPTTAGASGASVNGQIVLPTEPKEIVRVFLDAMRSGNGEQLSALFSTNARAEILKQGIKIEPPGSNQATFVIGEAAPQGDAILVSSLWKEPPTVAGEEPQEMEVVWELRKEAAGWRVCGMAVDPGTGEEYEIVNFEKLDEPEVGNPAAPQTRVATLPQNGQLPTNGVQGYPAQSLPGSSLPAGMPQGLPQGGLPQGGMPQGGYPQGGLPQGGLNQGGLNQGGMLPQGGIPQGNQPSMGLPPSGLPGGLPPGGLPQNGLPMNR